MAKSQVSEHVSRLYALIRENGAWYDALQELGEKYKYEASDELLLMPILDEENPHAFYSICHYVENEPQSAYITRLLRLSQEMAKVCPDKLEFFIRRLIRSDSGCPLFQRAAGELSSQVRKILLAIVQGYLKDLKSYPNPAFEDRCRQLVAEFTR